MIQQWLVESAGIEPHILKANNKVIRGCFKVWELMNTSPPVFKGQLNFQMLPFPPPLTEAQRDFFLNIWWNSWR